MEQCGLRLWQVIVMSDLYTGIPKSSHAYGYILIAVGRVAGTINNADADYFYTETTNQQDPYLIVPFVGSLTLPSTFAIVPGTTSADIRTSAMLSVDYGDTGAEIDMLSTYTTPTDIQNGITVIPSTNTISWNFPYDSLTASTTGSLVFSPGPANDKLSYFFFQFSVPVTGTTTGTYVFSIYSSYSAPSPANPPFSVSGPSQTMLPIQFWWHCLAAGTQVTMADGSQQNIEALNNSHRVISGSHGGTLGVEATALGHHKASADRVGLQGIYRLRTQDGKELIATGAHPIMTPTGALMACHLNVGDAVLVTGGVSSVASCEPIDYSGMFYDLKLGNAEDRAKMGQHPVCTYHANGILVGDHLAMNAQADRQRYDLDFILPRIGADFRTDYANAVKDRNQ